jgi:type IX secretion system PorP/SprF family membrane protein
MKKSFFFVLFIIVFFKSYSQQIPVISQYMFNTLVLNPAIAGIKDEKIVTRLQNRNQWVGLENAPVTQLGTVHGFVEKWNVGLGAIIFNDVAGPVRQTGVQTAYSYHIRTSPESKIAFGLQAGLFQQRINTSLLTTDMPNDEAVTRAGESHWLPDASFGAFYYSYKYYLGFSIPHLIGGGISNTDFKLSRHYYIIGGYIYDLSDELQVEPSVLLRAVSPTPLSADFNAKVIYKEAFWIGASYRSSKEMIMMAGFRIAEKFYFGYSYDITFNPLSEYTKGSHELMIGFDIDKPGRDNKKGIKRTLDAAPSFL